MNAIGLTHFHAAKYNCNHITYGTVSAKIAPRLKCYKNALRLNRYNFPTDNAIDFLFSSLHTTPFHYEVLKIGSRLRYPLGCYSDSNAMHFYNILIVGQFSRKLSHIVKLNLNYLNHAAEDMNNRLTSASSKIPQALSCTLHCEKRD